jgi:2-dehydropantoate 2-reductase
MKIAIMGAGALGCYFGGRILQAGGDVSFIARGAHLEALRTNGLTIESPLGDAHIAPVTASDDPAEIGEADLVLFLVKLYDTEEAARAMAPLLGPNTGVLSFQNGVDAWQRIGAIVGEERVIGGTAYIPADIRVPGIIRHSGAFARLTFGEFDGSLSERCEAFQAILEKAGVEAQLVEDIDVRIWEKFIILSALSAITTLTRLPIGPIMADHHAARLFEAALRETHAVGMARCPGLSADAADRQMAIARGFPPHMRASMLDDLERGKRLELRDLSGAVVRIGKETGVPTPVHETVLAALHPYADGPPEERD